MRNSLTMLRKNSILILFSVIFWVGCGTPKERAVSIEKQSGPKLLTVVIQEMVFIPAELYVNDGDTVMWINKDIVTHNIMEETNKEWSSSPLAAGQSWKMVVNKNADYFCSLHPVMKGKLILK